MLGTIFILFLIAGLFFAGFAFKDKSAPFLVLASILFMGAGLLILDTSPGAGIEEEKGFFVRSTGDNNFVIDVNTTYRNAGNDPSLNILGNLFTWGGMIGIIMALGFLVQGQVKRGKNG